MKKIFRAHNKERLDKFLARSLNIARNQAESLIKKGLVKSSGEVLTKCGYRIEPDRDIEVYLPEPEKEKAKKVDFEVEIIYEDDFILVLNKPAGLTVHPAPSVKEPTLVDWLKYRGFSLSTIAGEERTGIVHRLDKETSGVLVVAKSDTAHSKLSLQLQDRTMGRYYLALIEPPLKENLVVERPIGRNPKNRLKMAVVPNGKEAKSAFAKIAVDKTERIELIGAKLHSGRTHQIRVHLSSLGRHILGDSLYGFKSRNGKIERVFLHAYILYLTHPKSGERMRFTADLPQDMRRFIEERFEREKVYEKIVPNGFDKLFDTIFGRVR